MVQIRGAIKHASLYELLFLHVLQDFNHFGGSVSAKSISCIRMCKHE
jgi:hypothetical protein